MRPLSHSSISMYAECPRKYRFKYVDKLPEKPKSFFSFGKSVHAALEFFYNIPALPAPTLDQILSHYKQNWISEGYKDLEEEQKYYDEGETILRRFHARHIADFKLPFFAEYKFEITVDGVPVLGFVDRIDKVGGDRLSIVDYKTGKAFGEDRVKTDAQLTMYQMACEELLGLPVESLTFYHLNSLTAHTAKPHSKDQVQDLRRRIVATAESIQRGLFEPKPAETACRWCDFKPHCPVFRDHYIPAAPVFGSKPRAGRKAARPSAAGTFSAAAAAGGLFAAGTGREETAPPSPSGAAGARLEPASTTTIPIETPAPNLRPQEDEALARLVDRCGQLTEEINRLEAEVDQLQGDLTAKLQARGWVRAFGAAYEATLSLEEKWEFADKAKVLEVIRRSGHWEDVLAPSAPLVQKFMSNPAVPPDLRRRLEALGRKVEHTKLALKRTE